MNMMVLRGDLSGNPSFRELLQRSRRSVLDAVEHQDFPFPLLVQRLRVGRDPARSLVFQTAFVSQQTQQLTARMADSMPQSGEPRAGAEHEGLALEPYPTPQQEGQFDITLEVFEGSEALTGGLKYNKDLFDAATIQRMLDHFRNVLDAIVTDPDRPISSLTLLSQRERQQLVVGWNDTSSEYQRDVCVHDLFASQALQQPDVVAVESDGQKMTYGDLKARASGLATHLRHMGVGPGELVGVFTQRSTDMVVGLLGALEAGGAYLPLDPAFPANRLAFMLSDATPRVILTQEELSGRLPDSEASVVCLDRPLEQSSQACGDNNVTHPGSEDIAYVIYTSGSTGRPKGVQVSHRSVVNFLCAMAREPGLCGDDSLLSVTTLSFDISVLEIFLPLSVGARLVLADQATSVDAHALMEKLSAEPVTVMQATPATWRMLVDAGWKGDPELKALCGGEALPPDLANQLLGRVGELWNMYGPTETTVWSTTELVRSAHDITIGRPIANTQVYVLDSGGQPVPIGISGEIYIGGDGVADGYLNRPELTAERFLPDPFSPEPRAQFYRTGDIGRFQEDGRIEHLGRADHQVKIRGFRIELPEIESVLVSHAAVHEAVVTARDDRLVAYVIYEPGQDLSVTEVRSFLQRELPAYMIPALVVPMDAFPLTPNGKIDRKALPDPLTHGSVATREHVEPTTELERLIADVWADLLGVSRVGVHDDFFELGGHSLLAMQVITRVRSALQHELSVTDFFESPTVAGIAERVETSRWVAASVTAEPDSNEDREEIEI
jgi:amino acid adenylation domain-containing protein